MRQTTAMRGLAARVKSIKPPFDGGTVRLAAFTLAGVVAGSALAYALVNDQPDTDTSAIATDGPSMPTGSVQMAALPGVDLLDPIPLTPAADTGTETAGAKEERPAEIAAAPPAPERFGAADPATQAVLDAGPDLAGTDTPLNGIPIDQVPVEFAATEDEVVAIEVRLAAAGDPNFVLPPEGGTGTAVVAEPSLTGSTGAETVATGQAAVPVASDESWSDLITAEAARYVNLRDAPDNESNVIRVVPAGASLSVQAGCESWCAVIHEGTRGYIYESFINRSEI